MMIIFRSVDPRHNILLPQRCIFIISISSYALRSETQRKSSVLNCWEHMNAFLVDQIRELLMTTREDKRNSTTFEPQRNCGTGCEGTVFQYELSSYNFAIVFFFYRRKV